MIIIIINDNKFKWLIELLEQNIPLDDDCASIESILYFIFMIIIIINDIVGDDVIFVYLKKLCWTEFRLHYGLLWITLIDESFQVSKSQLHVLKTVQCRLNIIQERVTRLGP